MIKRKLAWSPSPADHRDVPLRASWIPMLLLPEKVDLRPTFNAIEDQGAAGSCVAHGVTAVLERADPNIQYSRMWTYWNARKVQGWTSDDSGCYIRDAMKVSFNPTIGVVPEVDYPYDYTKVLQAPTTVNGAHRILPFKFTKYVSVALNARNVCQVLSQGRPVVFGFSVPTTFNDLDSPSNSILKFPTKNTKIEGGHCVVAVGYVKSKKLFIIRNSYGTSFADEGYFYMPFEWMDSQLVNDGWTVV